MTLTRKEFLKVGGGAMLGAAGGPRLLQIPESTETLRTRRAADCTD